MTRTELDDAAVRGLSALGLEPGRPVAAAIEIAAPAPKVWAGLSMPGNLKRCHPFCESTAVERWPSVGAKDSIVYYSGRAYSRRFVDWRDGEGYDIELGERPNPTARVLWRIRPLSNAACRFSIEVFPYLRADAPDAEKAKYQERLFGDDLRHYLDCVVRGVDYWITTGEDVRPDQFGRNPLYSAPAAAQDAK